MNALKSIGLIVAFAIFGSVAWSVWFRADDSGSAEGGEAEVVTEVAVKAAKLIKTTLRRHVAAFGKALPEPATDGRPAAIATLALPSPGLISDVRCAEGQTVKQGDLLVALDTRQNQSRLDQARAAVDFATLEYARQQELLTIDGTAVKTVQNAKNELDKARLEVATAEVALSLLKIEAPISGVVTRVNVRRGESADPAVAAVEILDPSRLVFAAQFPVASSAELRQGQPASYLRDGVPLPQPGAVTYVSPDVNAQSGTVEVRLSIPPDAGVRAGEWLEVRIVTEEKAGVLAAPIESVTLTGEGDPVIARIQGDTATQIPVKAGLRDGGLVEVEGEGLTEGAMVVTEGAYGLPETTRVRIVSQ